MNIPPINTNYQRRTSATLSWLGFGLSLFALITTAGTSAILIYGNDDESARILLIMLTLFIVFIIGSIGFVMSLIGIISAAKSGASRIIGVFGLCFFPLSIICLAAPRLITTEHDKAEIKTEITHGGEINTDDPLNETDARVIIEIDHLGTVKCRDNRLGNAATPAKFKTYSTSLKHELSVWFETNNISKDERIVITYHPDADYSNVVEIVDILKSMGRKYYKIQAVTENTPNPIQP
jgi:biopolymer transport protein ExbD